MSVINVHPQYEASLSSWEKMRDCHTGEERIKEKGEVYLPATQGMKIDGMLKPTDAGSEAYKSYLLRSVFPEFVSEAVERLVGLLHQEDAVFELPTAMQPLIDKASSTGESLAALLRRINAEQLITGRVGLLVDLPIVPDPANPLPYISLYVAEAIRNWDDGEGQRKAAKLDFLVLDESTFYRDENFVWTFRKVYRVLTLGTLIEPEGTETAGDQFVEAPPEAIYLQGLFGDRTDLIADFDPTRMMTPMIRGKVLEEIPFFFANSKDILASTDKPPLLTLANSALTVYRGEADYRQNLFMQGQDTLVVTGSIRNQDGIPGEDDAIRTGAGARIDLDMGGTAEYIGVSGSGLSEQRTALENDYSKADAKTGQLIKTGSAPDESGEALKTRIAAQTATLNQIALTGGFALENALKCIARWMGLNADEVIVTPNTEFADDTLDGQELLYLMQAKQAGLPLSLESIHKICVDRNMTELSYEDEMEKVTEENANASSQEVDQAAALAAATNPNPDPNALPANKTPAQNEPVD